MGNSLFPTDLEEASLKSILNAAGVKPQEAAAPAPTSGSIIDANGNVWTLVGGQVAVNGAVDAGTSNVIELGYYNGLLWQESGAGNWWTKAKPTDPWTPSGAPPV